MPIYSRLLQPTAHRTSYQDLPCDIIIHYPQLVAALDLVSSTVQHSPTMLVGQWPSPSILTSSEIRDPLSPQCWTMFRDARLDPAWKMDTEWTQMPHPSARLRLSSSIHICLSSSQLI